MNCKQFSRMLQDYIDHNLSHTGLCEAREHLETCPHCARLVRDLQDASLLVRLLPREQAPVGFEKQVKERIAAARVCAMPPVRHGLWARLSGVSHNSPAFREHTAFTPALAALLLFAVIAVSALFINLSFDSTEGVDWGYIEVCQEQHASFASANPLADDSAVILRQRVSDLRSTTD